MVSATKDEKSVRKHVKVSKKSKRRKQQVRDDDAASVCESIGTQTAKGAGEAGWKGFCTAFSTILSRETAAKYIILSESFGKKHEDEQQQKNKEARLLAIQRKTAPRGRLTGLRLTNEIDLEFDETLRKVATRGVVRFFNALQEHRDNDGEERDINISKVPLRKRSKKLDKVSKEAFMKIWERGGHISNIIKNREGAPLGDIDPKDEFAQFD